MADFFNVTSNVSQFGPDDCDINRYKQAGEYALESKQWACLSKQYHDDAVTDVTNILENAGDQATLVALAQPEGFGVIGQAFYQDIRGYQGNHTSVFCRGGSAPLDGGEGIFDLYTTSSTTIQDDGCVHIIDSLGRVWKRRMVDSTVYMKWAGAKTLTKTQQPQDDAFKACLKAAANLSSNGYPQSIITGSDSDVIYLSERHYIRCGNFPESLSWDLPPNSGGRFGIRGRFALGQGAGWFIVQANRPLFDIEVDNTGISFTTKNFTDAQIKTLVEDNYMLRLESMVNAPEMNIKASNYPGTVLYSKGKWDYSDVTAQWPDLNKTLPSMQNLGSVVFNAKTCGRDFFLNNCGAGFGHMHSVWTQNNSQPGLLRNMYDVTLTFEDYVPHNETRGGLIIDTCGTLSLENILIGAGGIGHLCIWDSRNCHINRNIAICGNTTYAASNHTEDLYAMEICNSEVHISGAHAQNSGRYLRVGFNSQVTFDHLTCWDVCKLIEMTNDLTKLKYRGQRVAAVLDPVRVYINSGFAQALNSATMGWPCAPVITIDNTVGQDFKLFLRNFWMNNIHAGYTTEAEAKLAIISCESDSELGTVDIDSGVKLEGNTNNYVIRLAKKGQLGMVRTRQTDFCRVRYTDDNSQSSFAMRESPHPLTNTPIPSGTVFSYPYRRPGRYRVDITINGGSASVTINGQVRYRFTSNGLFSLWYDLKYQEQVSVVYTGSVVESTPQWRYILEE